MIKPQECLHLQLFSLHVCRHTQQELRGDAKRNDNRLLWMSTEGSSLARMVIQVQPNNVCVKNYRESGWSSASRWLGKTAYHQRNTRQGCVDGKTARQPGWKDKVHGGPECRPCGVVWRDRERHQRGGL